MDILKSFFYIQRERNLYLIGQFTSVDGSNRVLLVFLQHAAVPTCILQVDCQGPGAHAQHQGLHHPTPVADRR